MTTTSTVDELQKQYPLLPSEHTQIFLAGIDKISLERLNIS